MASVSIAGDRLIVRLTGWQAVFALRREIDIALNNVVSAQADTVTSKRPNGLRLPGTYLPNVITAGSYWRKEQGWSFWSVRHEEMAIDIRLRDTHYYRLVIEVDDPQATAALIEDAIRVAAQVS